MLSKLLKKLSFKKEAKIKTRNYFPTNELQIELLVHGYVSIIDIEIPNAIINIIFQFCNKTWNNMLIAVLVNDSMESLRSIIEFDILNKEPSKQIHSDIWTNIDEGMYCYDNNFIYRIGVDIGDNIMYDINANISEKLPNNIVSRKAASLVHSSEHGLITLGGCTQSDGYMGSVEVLKYKKQDTFEDKWEYMAPLKNIKAGAGCTIFSDNNREYIFECCGWNGDISAYFNDVNIYDFETNKWKNIKSLKEKRTICGVGYDSFKNRMIIGGGYPTKKKLKYYDFHKKKRYNNFDKIYKN